MSINELPAGNGPFDLIEEIRTLVERLAEIEDWAEGPSLVRELTRLGFFSGFSSPELFGDIHRRLTDHREEKECLARYLHSDLLRENPSPASIFLESGSTLAYFAKRLAEQNHTLPLVLTNNFLVQTLLFEKTEIRVTGGALRKTYLAYLPFERASTDDPVAERLTKDRVAFRRLERQLDAIDLIYATSSTFGFLLGPATGKRDNAIFKYCLFNHQAHHRIKFCITEPKVFRSIDMDYEGAPGPSTGPTARQSARYEWNLEDLESEMSIPRHLNVCRLVFDLNLLSDAQPPPHRTRGSVPYIPDRAIDGLALVDDSIRRHGELSDRHSPIEFRSAPMELGLRQHGLFKEAAPVYGAHDTWLDYLDAQPSGLVEVLIGCDSPARVESLWRAAEDANAFVSAAGYRFAYQRVADEPGKNVLHLRVVR